MAASSVFAFPKPANMTETEHLGSRYLVQFSSAATNLLPSDEGHDLGKRIYPAVKGAFAHQSVIASGLRFSAINRAKKAFFVIGLTEDSHEMLEEFSRDAGDDQPADYLARRLNEHFRQGGGLTDRAFGWPEEACRVAPTADNCPLMNVA